MNEVVWFKRDLRVRDHVPLAQAAVRAEESGGGLICLFVYEPEWIAAPETDGSHIRFVNECLLELEERLNEFGGRLITRTGSMLPVLSELKRQARFGRLWSHEETGSDWTYRRDLSVARWCREQGVEWVEIPQHGVVRRLRSRNGWANRWEQRMHQPPVVPQFRLQPVSGLASDGIRTEEALGVNASSKVCQLGGETRAWETLADFLSERGLEYRRGMSSPVSGATACSRLSPYLAWGCISLRETVHTAEQKIQRLRDASAAGAIVNKGWFGALRSFGARLRWHCHFMQKLEDEPRIEFENVHRGYDGLRDEMTASAVGRQRLQLWKEGRTGYPMVDACMRSCMATGWLNFRMRAMVASFAAYHLWLHWREPAVFLARHFLDFEAGIHFSQFQMQSGTTGINTLRIYSPAKQMLEQDPTGEFVRKWVPELEGVPLAYLSEPHRMPEAVQRASGCRIDHNYPSPLVDHVAAYRQARERFSLIRRSHAVREEAKAVFQRHGSRKNSRRRPPTRQPPPIPQMELPLDENF
jgi:deoxyribodipyrimidine photo-lyase